MTDAARNEHGNVIITDPNYEQVCVLPGVTMGEIPSFEFVSSILEEFQTRVLFLEETVTNPSRNEYGFPEEGTGGLAMLIFAVHKEDVAKFAAPRPKAGIRWIEDVMATGNNRSGMYPVRLKEYGCWDIEG
jgi:hypothetical protein